jgi:hypothetical protein
MKISSAITELHAGHTPSETNGNIFVVFVAKALENTQIVSRQIILVRLTTP